MLGGPGEARSSREVEEYEEQERSAAALSEDVSAWFEVCNSWNSWQQILKSLVTLYSKYSMALTFENLIQAGTARAVCRRDQWRLGVPAPPACRAALWRRCRSGATGSARDKAAGASAEVGERAAVYGGRTLVPLHDAPAPEPRARHKRKPKWGTDWRCVCGAGGDDAGAAQAVGRVG